MTPAGLIGSNQPSPTNSPNLYSQVSSMGVSPENQDQTSDQQPQMESLVDKATKRFGSVFTSFVALTESYPGSDKEATAVKDALANWLSSVANRINESQGSSSY